MPRLPRWTGLAILALLLLSLLVWLHIATSPEPIQPRAEGAASARAPVDASTSEPAPEPAVEPAAQTTVRVLGCGRRPVGGAQVVFLVEDRAVAQIVADAGGKASAALPEGATVTVEARFGALTGASFPTRDAEIVVSLCDPATVEGRVVDRRGEGVVGARVTLEPGEDEAVTDATGAFALTAPFLLAARVVADSEGRRAVVVLPTLRPGERREVLLTLGEGRTVRGRVLDPRGKPVADARVTARDPSRRSVGTAMSDAEGRFALDGAPEERLTLVARAGARVSSPVTVPAKALTGPVTLILSGEGMLRLVAEPGLVGRFEVKDLTPGTDTPLLGREPGPEATLPVPAPRQVEVFFRLEASGGRGYDCGQVWTLAGRTVEVLCSAFPPRLSGVAVDANGRVLPGAAIRVTVRGTGSPPASAQGTTDAGGAFALEVRGNGSASVTLSLPGTDAFPVQRRDVIVQPGTETHLGQVHFITAQDATAFRNPQAPFGGLGAQLMSVPGGVRVSRVADGGPLQAAGVQSGDMIIGVEGDAITTYSLTEVVHMLRGEPGTRVRLLVRRPDGTDAVVEVERDVVDPKAAIWK